MVNIKDKAVNHTYLGQEKEYTSRKTDGGHYSMDKVNSVRF